MLKVKRREPDIEKHWCPRKNGSKHFLHTFTENTKNTTLGIVWDEEKCETSCSDDTCVVQVWGMVKEKA